MKPENRARLETAQSLIADAAGRIPQDSAFDLLKHAAVQLEAIAADEGGDAGQVAAAPAAKAAAKKPAAKK
jgi:hypothetical protein